MTAQFSCITETEKGVQHPGIVGPYKEGVIDVAEIIKRSQTHLKGIFVVERQVGVSVSNQPDVVVYVIKGTADIAMSTLKREHPRSNISIGTL